MKKIIILIIAVFLIGCSDKLVLIESKHYKGTEQLLWSTSTVVIRHDKFSNIANHEIIYEIYVLRNRGWKYYETLSQEQYNKEKEISELRRKVLGE